MLHDFFSLLFPNYCEPCGLPLAKGESLICSRCRLEMPRGKLIFINDSNAEYPTKLQGIRNLHLSGSYYRFTKGGKVQKLLHALKYSKKPEVGELIGKWIGAELKMLWKENLPDLILPVPLHPKKKRKRGYNQSDFLARGIASGLEIGWSENYLKRIVNNSTQTRKNKVERWQNVEKVFKLEQPDWFALKHVLLVDDVLTTGSTLEACAEIINQAGAASISAITLADAG